MKNPKKTTVSHDSAAQLNNQPPQNPVGEVGGVGGRETKRRSTSKSTPVTGMRTAISVGIALDDLTRPYALITLGATRALLPTSDMFFGYRELATRLGAQGVLVPDKKTVSEIQHAYAVATRSPPTLKVRLLPGFSGDGLFLHGANPIGETPRGLLVDPASLMLGDRPRKFGAAGDLKTWRKKIKRFATNQPLVTFVLAAAFASMILRRLRIQPFVIVLHAHSSVGKSHLAALVGSVFGGDPGRPALGFAESFKATEAGIEKLAFAHNDALLILDELSRLRGSAGEKVAILEGFVNDFCAGVPMTRAINAMAGLQWSGVALVTSNKSYSQLLAEAGQLPEAAMGPRLIDLPADLGRGNGIFRSLPSGFENSQDAVKAMHAAASEVYGVAAPTFARALIEADKNHKSEISGKLAAWTAEFADWVGTDLPFVQAHLRDKFAAIYATGRLAKDLGVLPKTVSIKRAVRWAWEVAVPAPSQSETVDPIKAVADYIRKNRGHFRRTPLPAQVSLAKAERMPGFKHESADGDRAYLIPKAAFGRAFNAMGGSATVMRILFAKGFAKAEDAPSGKFKVKRYLRPGLRMRVFCISASILKH